jgi:hypothetical protein
VIEKFDAVIYTYAGGSAVHLRMRINQIPRENKGGFSYRKKTKSAGLL